MSKLGRKRINGVIVDLDNVRAYEAIRRKHNLSYEHLFGERDLYDYGIEILFYSGSKIRIWWYSEEALLPLKYSVDYGSVMGIPVKESKTKNVWGIVDYRDENGGFKTRKELLKVKRLGQKAYEQCAGFLRVAESKEPLDNTAVHPESYGVAKKLIEILGYTIKDLKDNNLLEIFIIHPYNLLIF